MSIIIPPPLVPLAGVALVAIVTLLTRRRSTKSYGAHAANRELEGSASDAVPRRSVTGLVTMAWELGLLLFLALWCHFGLVPVSLRQVALVSAVFTAGALLGLARDRVFGWLDAAEKEGGTGFASFVAALLRFAPLLSATLFAQLALELPWNPEVLGVAPQWLALEFALMLLLVICAYLLTQRTGIGPQLVARLRRSTVGRARIRSPRCGKTRLPPGILRVRSLPPALQHGKRELEHARRCDDVFRDHARYRRRHAQVARNAYLRIVHAKVMPGRSRHRVRIA